MAEDTYRYQPIPLPSFGTVGIETFSPSQVSPTQVGGPNVDTPYLDSPFSNPDFTGGGSGGGGTTPTCATSWQIGAITTSGINLPCSGPALGVITDGGVSVATSGGDSASLIAETGVLELVSGGKTIYLQASAIGADSGDIELIELDVPHMGAPGKRQFVCGLAYAP